MAMIPSRNPFPRAFIFPAKLPSVNTRSAPGQVKYINASVIRIGMMIQKFAL